MFGRRLWMHCRARSTFVCDLGLGFAGMGEEGCFKGLVRHLFSLTEKGRRRFARYPRLAAALALACEESQGGGRKCLLVCLLEKSAVYTAQCTSLGLLAIGMD